MAEYIERDMFLKIISCKPSSPTTDREDRLINYCISAVKNFPAADVRPVVRGRWVGYPECLKYMNAYADDHIVCSACEECFSILDNDCERFNFCPNCGARMEE